MNAISTDILMTSFTDMPPDKKQAALQYILFKELYLDQPVKNWLKKSLRSESDDLLRAMMIEALGADIDDAEIRSHIETVLKGLSKESLTYNEIQTILIAAVSDDMTDVKNWSIRLLREHERINAEDEKERLLFLDRILENETLPPRLRWHSALGLAHIGTAQAVEKLIRFGKKVVSRLHRAVEPSEHCFENDISVFLAEKIAYSLGVAAGKMSVHAKKKEMLNLLEDIAAYTGEDENEKNPVSWAICEVKKLPAPSIVERILAMIYRWLSFAFNPKFIPVMAAACLILFFVFKGSVTDNIPVTVSIIGNAEMPKRMKGSETQIEPFELKQGESLKSGDSFRVNIRIEKDAYIYVLLHDSSGETVKLFGDEVKAGQVLSLPDENSGFRLDDNRGTETVFVLASEKPIDDFDKKLEQLKKAGIAELKTIFPDVSIESFEFKHE
jgi:hypothetical protein